MKETMEITGDPEPANPGPESQAMAGPAISKSASPAPKAGKKSKPSKGKKSDTMEKPTGSTTPVEKSDEASLQTLAAETGKPHPENTPRETTGRKTQPQPKGSVVDDSERGLSEIGSEQKSDKPAADATEGWENIGNLVVDPEMSPRAQLDEEYNANLQDRIEAGDRTPKIQVTRPDLKVTSGGHRYKALMAIAEKVRRGQLKAASLGYPMNAEGTMIRVRYDVIPDGVDPMIYCYRQNTTHGLRPSAEDTKRVVEAYYRKKPGRPAKFFAEQLQISQKAAEHYVRGARDVWNKERDWLIRELHKAGLTQQKIAETLEKKWPGSKVSQTLVSQMLSQTSTERQGMKGSRVRKENKPTPISKRGQSSHAGNVGEAEHTARETSIPSIDHSEELTEVPPGFSWGMDRRHYGRPGESFEIRINGLRSLRADQYEAINEAIDRVQKICKEIQDELNKVKVQQLLGEAPETREPQTA